jgi:hypothetical protein
MPAGLRKVYQYNLDGSFVTEHQNISAASFAMNEKKQSLYFCLTGKYNYSRGYFWTYSYYLQLPQNIIDKIKNSKKYKVEIYKISKVYKYDLKGNFIEEYNCLNDISNDKIYKKNILRVLEGRHKISDNFIWRIDHHKKLPKDILKNHTHNAKKIVYQYDLKGNFIKEYISSSHVAESLNVKPGSVSNALNGIRCKVYKNFIWRTDYYKKLPKDILNFHLKIKKPPILQYTLDGEFIKEWELEKLKNKFRMGNIYSVLTGVRTNACGFIWKYKE